MNIPYHYRDKHLIEKFSDFGAIASIELPLKNQAVEDILKNKQDKFSLQSREKAETERRTGEYLIHQSLMEN